MEKTRRHMRRRYLHRVVLFHRSLFGGALPTCAFHRITVWLTKSHRQLRFRSTIPYASGYTGSSRPPFEERSATDDASRYFETKRRRNDSSEWR